MNSIKMTSTEIQQSAQAFIASGLTAEQTVFWTNFMSHQTVKTQDKFWAIVKTAQVEVNA